MSLSSTMWTSVSGLINHGKKMNTIGNNIANINTVGFKGQRMDFADFVYQNTNSLAGATQNGFGVQVGAIMGNFSQGSFETTQEATDLAINGNGFFQVQKPGSDEAYYTRAGNFRFDKSGYLLDPNGFALQGWRIDNSGGVTQAQSGTALFESQTSTSPIQGSGVPTDIQLDTWSVFPQQTTKMDFRVNVPQEGADNAQNVENPFTALLNIWDGTQPPATPDTPAIAQTSYAEQTTMQIYDEAGVKHTVTVYFDKVDSADYQGGNSGEQIWEYIVTMDPSEDKRQYMNEDGDLVDVNSTKMGGILMAGTMTYNSAGMLVNQSSYTWGGTQTPVTNPGSFTEVADPAGGLQPLQVINLDPTDLANWQPAAISSNGYPIVVPNFSGILDAQTSGTANGAKYNTEITFGLKASNYTQPWTTTGSLASFDVAPYLYNTAYTPNNPTNGPEYVLLNTEYDAGKDDRWDLSTNRYAIGGTGLWALEAGGTTLFNAINDQLLMKDGITQVDADNYVKSIEYYGLSSVRITAGSASTTSTIPSETVNIDLITGEITNAEGKTSAEVNAEIDAYNAANAGTPGHVDKVHVADNFGIDISDSEQAAFIGKTVSTAMAQATPKGLYLITEAIPANANYLANLSNPVLESNSSTNLSGSFSSSNAQDGYGYGDLTSWNFDADGVLYGVYSNGVNLPLWQVTMYDFTNDQGLRREGNNLFSQTRDSGEPKTGAAGNSGFGTIAGYSLEQSNVDMSTEFVYMITTQRGYQANSKSITTVDSMLETVIQMKR